MKQKESERDKMTDQLFKVVMGHLHDLLQVQDRQLKTQAVKAILPPIIGIVRNNSVVGRQSRAMRRAVKKEFIMQFLGCDGSSLESGKSADDAAEKVGHGWVDVEDH